MSTFFYTTGQAARELSAAQGQIRNLCQTGAIAAEITAGGQWRIPKAEVDRLKRDGLPAVPRPLPEEGGSRPPRKNAGRDVLLAPPSNVVAESAEAAAMSGHQVQIARNRVELLRAKKEAAEIGDFFEGRERRRLEDEAVEREREAQAEAAERERQERAEAERERREFVDRWLRYAIDSLPWGTPQEARPDVQEHVEAVLARLRPDQPDSVVRSVVDGAASKALAPWKRRKERQKVIDDACEDYRLPLDLRYREPWKSSVRQAIAAAVEAQPETAARQQLEAAAAAAVAPLVREYEHQQRCQRIVSGAGNCLPSGATYEDRQEAEELVREALAPLPEEATERQMEKARDGALAPICAAINEREQRRQAEEARQQDQRMRESVIQSANIRLPWGMGSEATEEALTEIREALAELPEGTPRSELDAAAAEIIEQYKTDHEREQNKQGLIQDGLREIYAYIGKLLEKWDFDGKSAWTLEQEITPAIREGLEAALEGDEDAEELARLTRRLVREELGL